MRLSLGNGARSGIPVDEILAYIIFRQRISNVSNPNPRVGCSFQYTPDARKLFNSSNLLVWVNFLSILLDLFEIQTSLDIEI